jgi:8-oxo-dGTP diphosphatase
VTSVLLRHASAGDRDRRPVADRLRPLDHRGRLQAAALVEILRPLGVSRVVSSPYVRCIETVQPLAAALELPLEPDHRLAEGAGSAALELVREHGVVCCTHGDVVEAVLGHGLKKAAAVVLEGTDVVREIPPPQ